MAKEGSTIGGLMDSLGTAISVALQYGVPLKSLVKKFEHQRFEPMGMTMNQDIPFAKSLVDYIFRWLGLTFLEDYRDQYAPRREAPAALAANPSTVARHNDLDDDDDEHESAARLQRTDDSGVGLSDARSAVRGAEPAAKKGRAPASGDRVAASAATGVRIVKSATMTEMRTMNVTETRTSTGVMDQQNAQMMGDAPACDECGAITVRNGTCYKCLNCGNSMGCS